MGVAWHRFLAFFNIYFKRDDDGRDGAGRAAADDVAAARPLDLEEADPEDDTFGAGKIEDFSWKGWLDFTTCTECGRCQSQCPAWNTGKPLSPKLVMLALRDHALRQGARTCSAGGGATMTGDEVGITGDGAGGGARGDRRSTRCAEARAPAGRHGRDAGRGHRPGGAVGCTTCGACVEQCPVDIEHVDHIVDMRRYQVHDRVGVPLRARRAVPQPGEQGQPVGAERSGTGWPGRRTCPSRSRWSTASSSRTTSTCSGWAAPGAFDDRAKKTTRAVAELLHMRRRRIRRARHGETCTGDPARRAGNEFLFQMLASRTWRRSTARSRAASRARARSW